VNERQNTIALLERALEAAQRGAALSEVGQLIARASEAAGVPHDLFQLAREARARGYSAEADLVRRVVEIASSTDKQGELYHHAMLSLHDLACECLDELGKEACRLN
jgi:hypothetical protein